jgi:glycosyltransferase involved in cell wall biosynthesis
LRLTKKSAEADYMTKSLRIVLISHTFGEYCVQLANGLARYGDVLLMLPTEVAVPHREHLDHAVRLFTYPNPRFRRPILQFRMLRTLLHVIGDFGPDVIHYQGGHPWLDLTLALVRSYPLVLTVHDVRPHPGDRLSKKTPLWMAKFLRHRADRLIVQTKFARDEIIRDFPAADKRISVVPHIQIGRKAAPLSNRDDRPLILFFGRIWKYKGLQYLIRAEPLITASVPDATFLIAGQGEKFSRYSRMMVHPERFIVDNEFILQERATEYFARASVVVLPYIEASQSGVISMAYTAGKPVVASAVGGLPEMVEDGRTGYLVPPRDVSQLAGCINLLLLDHDLRDWMGANARAKIEAECSPDVIAKATMDVYARAIEQGVRCTNQPSLRRSPTVVVSSSRYVDRND